MSERDPWTYGTWDGARQAQLRRSLRLTVRERLQALDELGEVSERIARAGREASHQQAVGRCIVRLAGCSPTPLASYLKALGVLRLVAEQVDPTARGRWGDVAFVIESGLDREKLVGFLLQAYRPTPIVAPWNGGSGFYPKDNAKGIEPIEKGSAERFAPLRGVIEASRGVLEAMGVTEKPDTSRKSELLERLRGKLGDDALAWMDAAVVLTEERPRYPPLLGTGGNDGRLEFTNNFLQGLVGLFDPQSGAPKAEAARLLGQALFDDAVPGLESSAIGQFAPGAAGGPNASSSFEGSALVNPWDFVLMLEGSVLFAAAATRRLEAEKGGELSYPFTVRASGVGTGAADLADEGSARGEMWMPLWSRPVGLVELRALLGEGRATVGRRNARDGVDFARAVARLGVDRGVREFQRFGFLQRYGRTFLATPLNRVPVRGNPTAALIDQLERRAWLGRFRRYARRKEAPARLTSLRRRLDDALFELSLRGASSPRPAQDVVITLGRIMRYLALTPQARERCGPVPLLDQSWVSAADDSSAEFALAAALASIHHDTSELAGGGARPYPMLVHFAPVEAVRRQDWDEGAGHDVVWGPGLLETNLRHVLERRLLEAQRSGSTDRPFAAWVTAPVENVGSWLEDRIDTRRVGELLSGLTLARIAREHGAWGHPGAEGRPLPGAYRLLKPFFCTNAQLRRSGVLEGDASLPLPRELVRALGADRLPQAIGLARRRLRIAGLGVPRHLNPEYPDALRLLGALLVPISDGDLRGVVAPLFQPANRSKSFSPSTEEVDDAD